MKRMVFATLLALTIPVGPGASDGSLLDALREGKPSEVRGLFKSGADPSVGATSAAYQRGVEYLLRTQLEDGTWFMQTRAFAFQPHVDTGFPHGANQFIAAAATSWAAIALTYAM